MFLLSHHADGGPWTLCTLLKKPSTELRSSPTMLFLTTPVCIPLVGSKSAHWFRSRKEPECHKIVRSVSRCVNHGVPACAGMTGHPWLLMKKMELQWQNRESRVAVESHFQPVTNTQVSALVCLHRHENQAFQPLGWSNCVSHDQCSARQGPRRWLTWSSKARSLIV